MEKEKIERINFLARKSRGEGLSDEEKAEQQALRDEYRQFMRNGYMSQLDSIYVVDDSGNKRKLINRSKDQDK